MGLSLPAKWGSLLLFEKDRLQQTGILSTAGWGLAQRQEAV
ncbi:hypothetical protein NW849_09730 [Synechococcus sp. R55.3]